MKIMVVNPNTSESMTNHIRTGLEKMKRQDTELHVVHPPKGPETIETSFEEALAIPHMLRLVEKANVEKYDAVIIADYRMTIQPRDNLFRDLMKLLLSEFEQRRL